MTDSARTFTVASDEALVKLISSARNRLVVIAPALTQAVADAVSRRFIDIEHLGVTVILDSDPEVYRRRLQRIAFETWFLSRMYARSVGQIGLLASSNRQRPTVFDAPQGRLPQCLQAGWHASMSGALSV